MRILYSEHSDDENKLEISGIGKDVSTELQ